MDVTERPWRSVLYIPASKARALEKAKTIPADAIIFDLEDAVAPDEKAAARAALAAALDAGGYAPRARIVRVNGLDTDWGPEDLRAASGLDCEAVLVPKAGSPDDIGRAAALADDKAVWAMMETPAGILNAAGIAAHPRLKGLVLGTNDLAKELGCRFRADRLPMMHGLQACVLAARAAGVVCIDGVFNAFRDENGLRAECEQGRDMGMDGKTLIHPGQVAIANEVFGPSEEEICLAERQIAAFDEAVANGEGVAVLDGSIVENLHAAAARATLKKARAIRTLENA